MYQSAKVTVDFSARRQLIDGFGVNINSKYWAGGKLAPVVDLLIDDLGATLFRLDHYGRANWMDPQNTRDRSVLNREEYDRVYEGRDFQNAAGMARHLNARGIEPYITISGVPPRWMCAEDGKTLEAYDDYADMAADYAAWLKAQGVRFRLFGPLNETDLGPPEGPLVDPDGYVMALKAIVRKLDERGLRDVQLVAAEQGTYNLNYARAIFTCPALRDRVAVFGVHAYSDFRADDLVKFLEEANGGKTRAWMTEFNDLKQDMEHEQLLATKLYERLMRLLDSGMNGALVWDAFDNYHDHDETWTQFGLLTNTWDVFEPKKRYAAARHVFRFVRPGFHRIEARSTHPDVQVLAFASEDGASLTVAGMNLGARSVLVDLDLGLSGMASALPYLAYDAYRTCAFEDCAKVTKPVIRLHNRASSGIEVAALPGSFFTITNVK
jgi:O-glycosyl hydrolase